MTENRKNTKPRKGNMLAHIILGVIIVGIIAFIAFRLARWNSNKIVISSDDDGTNELECLDYYVHPSEEQSVLRNSDGKEHILIIGNQYLTRSSDDSVTILELLEQKVDAKFYTLIAESTTITAVTSPNPADSIDTLNLYAVVSKICSDDRSLPTFYALEPCFSKDENLGPYLETLNSIDLNTIDTVLIMYDLMDYFHSRPSIAGGSDNVRGMYGSLYCSVELLQAQYPHLEIIISSPIPGYIPTEDGMILSSEYDAAGFGNSSTYVNTEYNVALERFVSYIDNYYYVVDEDNITEYSAGARLTPKGVEAIATHVAEFLNK